MLASLPILNIDIGTSSLSVLESEWVFDNEQVSKTCWFTDLCFPDVLKAKPGAIKRKVAMINEPRAIYPQTYEWVSQNNRLFDFVLTYDKELLDRGENFLYYPHSRCWINKYNNEDKTKMCSIFASPKRFTTGHAMRHEVIERFRDKMDVFGKELIVYLGLMCLQMDGMVMLFAIHLFLFTKINYTCYIMVIIMV